MNVAIFSDRHTRLPSNPAKETFVGIFADSHVDASAIDASASLTIVVLFGDTTVHVPVGSRVVTTGLSLFGERTIDVAGGDGPEITIKTYGAFTDLKVTDAPR